MIRFINNKNQSDFIKKIFKGTFLLSFGYIFSRTMLSLSFIILARILTTTKFGEYSIIKTTIDTFLIISSMGISITTTKFISELKDSDKQSASSILGTSLISVLFVGFFFL